MIWLILTLAVGGSSQVLAGGCNVSINDNLPNPQPVILEPNTNQFLYPSQDDNVLMKPGDTVKLVCTGSKNIMPRVNSNMTLAACVNGTKFIAAGLSTTIDFQEFNCSAASSHTARKTNQTCGQNGVEIEIGYNIVTSFIRTILVCFDESTYDALYSHFKLTKAIGGYQLNYRRQDFLSGNFYKNLPIPPSQLYTKEQQNKTFAAILGSAELANKYIQNNYYLARGHLAGKADFVFGTQQLATFWYINVAPQWQTFNGGNWKVLESDVRNFSDFRQIDLDVYTGIHGVATLPDVDNVERGLYLFADENGNRAITIPKFVWKVIYDSKTKLGTAFVGLNNPYKDLLPEDKLCTDMCDKIDWLDWKPNDKLRGFAYCCDVNELREKINTIPKFEVVGTLT